MFFPFVLVWVKKRKNPRLTGNRGFLKIVLLNQNFVPTMPKGRESRWQMAIQPLTGTCFISFTNVVFTFFVLNHAQ